MLLCLGFAMSVDDCEWPNLKDTCYAIKLKYLHLFVDVQAKLGSWRTSEKLTSVCGKYVFFSV